MIIPHLVSERLILRPHHEADLDASFEMWSDPSVTEHIGGEPLSRHQTWLQIVRFTGLWSLLGYGYWAIELRDSGTLIGQAGFGDFKRDLTPPMASIPEAGWAVHPRFAGQGYATEAITTALSWLDDNFTCDQCFCLINPRNIASERVATKVGFGRPRNVRLGGTVTRAFYRPRSTSAPRPHL